MRWLTVCYSLSFFMHASGRLSFNHLCQPVFIFFLTCNTDNDLAALKFSWKNIFYFLFLPNQIFVQCCRYTITSCVIFNYIFLQSCLCNLHQLFFDMHINTTFGSYLVKYIIVVRGFWSQVIYCCTLFLRFLSLSCSAYVQIKIL